MTRSVLMIGLALVFGGSAAVGVRAYLNQKSAAPAKTTPVVVAAADLPRGGMITAEMIKTRDYPKDVVPSGALTRREDAIGRAVAIPLLKDEVLLDAKLSPRGAGRGLAALVPKGMRAVTIQTPNVAAGVAGFVLPGNRVDVLLTVEGTGSMGSVGGGDETGRSVPEGPTTTTLLQNAEILAVDQRVEAPAENKVDTKDLRSVTLLVTPHQANLLDLGQNKGTLHLALRSHEDEADAGTRPVTLRDVRLTAEAPLGAGFRSLVGRLAELGKASATSRVTAAVSARREAPAPPKPHRIRTMRGRSAGAEYLVPASVGR